MFSREYRLQQAKEDLKFIQTLEWLESHKMAAAGSAQAFKDKCLEKELKAKPHGVDNYAWIGINPPPGEYTLKELYEKLLKDNPYTPSQAVVEQHTEGGIRPHIHQLVRVSSNTRKNHIITKLSKVYGLNPQSVQVNITKNKILIDKWEGYLSGSKKDNKMENVELDKIDREKDNIPDLISL